MIDCVSLLFLILISFVDNNIGVDGAQSIVAALSSCPGASNVVHHDGQFTRVLLPKPVQQPPTPSNQFTADCIDDLLAEVDSRHPLVGAAWMDVARLVARSSPLASFSALHLNVQSARSTLDQSLSQLASSPSDPSALSSRDAAVDGLLAALDACLQVDLSSVRLDEWRAAVDRCQPSAFRKPASAVSSDEWRKCLSDYEQWETASYAMLPYPDSMHARGAVSLSLALSSLPTEEGVAGMREELKQLRADTSLHSQLAERKKVREGERKKLQRNLRQSNFNLHNAIDDDESEEEIGRARSAVDAARSSLRQCDREMRSIESDSFRLASSLYPELKRDIGLPHRELDYYSDRRKLASSSNHPVYSAMDGNRSVVLKEFSVGESDLGRFQHELRLLQRLAEADGVVQVTHAFVHKHHAYIEMPRYEFGSLREWISSRRPSVDARSRAALRIVHAVERVHAAGIVHCDIKPDNVFVDAHDQPALGDFDVSLSTSDRTRLLHTQTLAHGGTPAYMAPELSQGQSATTASDVYSLGLVLMDLFGSGETRTAASPRPTPPVGMDGDLAALLRSMVDTNPSQRPRIQSVVSSPFFRSVRAAASLAMVAPMYWEMANLDGVVPRLVDVTDEMKGVVQQMVDKSVVPSCIGAGRDIPTGTPPYSRLSVVRVQRIESPALYRRYIAACDAIRVKRGTLPPASLPASEVDGWYGEDRRYVEQAEVGEKWLFHGTSADSVSKIVRDGFDMRLSGGLFGFGSYFAENADKADQYARSSTGEFPLFLCRVALGGCVATAERRDGVRRPPCIEGHYDGGTRCDHIRADSIVALCQRKDGRGCVASHREYVVYDLHQAYPQFLLTYRRM